MLSCGEEPYFGDRSNGQASSKIIAFNRVAACGTHVFRNGTPRGAATLCRSLISHAKHVTAGQRAGAKRMLRMRDAWPSSPGPLRPNRCFTTSIWARPALAALAGARLPMSTDALTGQCGKAKWHAPRAEEPSSLFARSGRSVGTSEGPSSPPRLPLPPRAADGAPPIGRIPFSAPSCGVCFKLS